MCPVFIAHSSGWLHHAAPLCCATPAAAFRTLCGQQMGDVAGLENDRFATHLGGLLAKLYRPKKQAGLGNGVCTRH